MFSEIITSSYEQFLQQEKEKFKERYNKTERKKDNEEITNFEVFQGLEIGGVTKVTLIRNKCDNSYYTLKLKEKKEIIKTNQVQYINREKKLLESLKFPFIINLEYFFTDTSYIYFVHPLVLGGDLFSLMKHLKVLPEDISRFYAAQLTLAIEYLHYMDIIYRNLRPENILICTNGYIKLTDFGFSKLIDDQGRTYSIVGSPEYLAPEILLFKGYGTAVDWWALGVLIYEMSCGHTPFSHKNAMQMNELICSGRYQFSKDLSSDLKDLIKKLLEIDLSKRFGNLKNGSNDVKDHKWFSLINWEQLLSRKASSPYMPPTISTSDLCQLKHPFSPSIDTALDEYANYFRNF